MTSSRRRLVAMLAMAVFAVLPLSAAASEVVDTREADTRVGETTISDSRETDVVRDARPVDRLVDDRVDRPDVTDRRRDITDRRPDVTDERRCLHLVDHPRRCHDGGLDDPKYVRQLIWRLINAHEWKKLVRLLHALGWV